MKKIAVVIAVLVLLAGVALAGSQYKKEDKCKEKDCDKKECIEFSKCCPVNPIGVGGLCCTLLRLLVQLLVFLIRALLDILCPPISLVTMLTGQQIQANFTLLQQTCDAAEASIVVVLNDFLASLDTICGEEFVPCPQGYTETEDGCVRLLSSFNPLTYAQAQSQCLREGAVLADVDSAAEKGIFVSLFPISAQVRIAWIGGVEVTEQAPKKPCNNREARHPKGNYYDEEEEEEEEGKDCDGSDNGDVPPVQTCPAITSTGLLGRRTCSNGLQSFFCEKKKNTAENALLELLTRILRALEVIVIQVLQAVKRLLESLGLTALAEVIRIIICLVQDVFTFLIKVVVPRILQLCFGCRGPVPMM